jgi:hypothetical protein
LKIVISARERVLAALAHEQPDRTPCDFWAEPPTWQRLLDLVGHADKNRLLDTLGVDICHLEVPTRPEGQVGEGKAAKARRPLST